MPSELAAAVATMHVAITAATLQGLPHQTIAATDEHGQTAQYGGVALRDVLTQSAVADRVVLIADSRCVRQVTAIDVEDAPDT